jgi:hypothetical protein
LIDRKFTELAVRALHEAFIEDEDITFVADEK